MEGSGGEFARVPLEIVEMILKFLKEPERNKVIQLSKASRPYFLATRCFVCSTGECYDTLASHWSNFEATCCSGKDWESFWFGSSQLSLLHRYELFHASISSRRSRLFRIRCFAGRGKLIASLDEIASLCSIPMEPFSSLKGLLLILVFDFVALELIISCGHS